MLHTTKTSALVLFSGGLDSTTCLFWAKNMFHEVHAVTFDYGQRHSREIEAAATVARIAKVASHFVMPVNVLQRSVTRLVDTPHYSSAKDIHVKMQDETFIPFRNLLFLTLAAGRAQEVGCTDLVLGVYETALGGYPDVRQVFIHAAERALSESTAGDLFSIHTPLMGLSKADIIRTAKRMEDCWEALAFTHSCYDGQYPPSPNNRSSLLRAKGFHEAGLHDPLIVRAKRDGLLPSSYPDDGFIEG